MGRSARSRGSCPSWEPPAEGRPGGSVRLPQGMLARSEGAGPDDDEVIPLLDLGEDVLIQPAVVGKCQRPSVVGFHAQLFHDLLPILFAGPGALVARVCRGLELHGRDLDVLATEHEANQPGRKVRGSVA